jgi:MFS family permease
LRRLPPIAAPQRINWLALFAMGMAVVVIANDFSAINVALPTMEKDFDTNINTIQWVVNAYALTFGVMIVTGGRLADMFGRRNAFFSAPRSLPRCQRSAAPPSRRLG